jgi:hypothetical protein
MDLHINFWWWGGEYIPFLELEFILLLAFRIHQRAQKLMDKLYKWCGTLPMMLLKKRRNI